MVSEVINSWKHDFPSFQFSDFSTFSYIISMKFYLEIVGIFQTFIKRKNIFSEISDFTRKKMKKCWISQNFSGCWEPCHRSFTLWVQYVQDWTLRRCLYNSSFVTVNGYCAFSDVYMIMRKFVLIWNLLWKGNIKKIAFKIMLTLFSSTILKHAWSFKKTLVTIKPYPQLNIQIYIPN